MRQCYSKNVTARTKFYIAGALLLGGALLMVRALYAIVIAGLGGSISKAGVAMLVIGFVVGVPAGVAYYYFKCRSGPKTQQQIAVETLAQLGKQRTKPRKK